jgi:hypothetical protein
MSCRSFSSFLGILKPDNTAINIGPVHQCLHKFKRISLPIFLFRKLSSNIK